MNSTEVPADPLPPEEPPPSLPLTVLAGALMGAADSVPGVSGGTIALIVGVYERFVTALSRVVRAPLLLRSAEGRRRLASALRLLVPLGIGLAAAWYVGTGLLVGKADHPGWLRREATAPLCYAFFFGLVLASLREPWRRIPRHRLLHVGAAVVTAVGAAAFIGLPYTQGEPPPWALLYGGALAVSVMLLPGVSGSLLLLVIGQYMTVTVAVHERDWPLIGLFLGGIALGLALFVPVLRHLLRRHHDLTMAALTGLMAGSLRALWPWKSNYDPKAGPLANAPVGEGVLWVVVAVVAGILAAWGLSRLEQKMHAGSSRSD